MSDKIIAYRYAKPLLELAVEQGVLEEVQVDMNNLTKICETNSQFRAVLQNPIIRGYKKLAILKKVFEQASSSLTLSFFEILAKHNRETILYQISKEFTVLYKQYKNILDVSLITTTPLTDALKQDISAKLAEKFNKTIHLTEEIKSDLIGGFILKIGDNQIDNSIKGSLQRLKMDFGQKINQSS